MAFDIDPIYLIWLFVAISAGLAAEAVYLLVLFQPPPTAATSTGG